MAIVSLVFAVIALLLIGVGIALGLVACAIAAVLVGLGVISSSVLAGIYSGRTTDGIRIFLLQCGIIAGVPMGAACAWVATRLMAELQASADLPVLVFGALGGALAGIVGALVLDQISRRLHARAAARFPGMLGTTGKAGGA
ncbi:hypothetical protein OKA04_07645 [Luteolibacter flavescens]|uniref:Uncharacterized protein n=1 Tax=Luteolibacter flavescens TaxID=1859460 RepID=A0ABT3FMC2_9BACT|nr:hypothetical protein [Luteolibacter flavescens]MCW1884602.1 hypothetical protein [Luteolibacter flavescens]